MTRAKLLAGNQSSAFGTHQTRTLDLREQDQNFEGRLALSCISLLYVQVHRPTQWWEQQSACQPATHQYPQQENISPRPGFGIVCLQHLWKGPFPLACTKLARCKRCADPALALISRAPRVQGVPVSLQNNGAATPYRDLTRQPRGSSVRRYKSNKVQSFSRKNSLQYKPPGVRWSWLRVSFLTHSVPFRVCDPLLERRRRWRHKQREAERETESRCRAIEKPWTTKAWSNQRLVVADGCVDLHDGGSFLET
jgi:hypothetical protein